MTDRLTASSITDEQLDALYAERDKLRASILDIDAHATPVGLADPDEPEGNPHHYAVTVGALHRALGKVGHTAASCTAEAERDGAYRERAQLLALLATLADSAVLAPAVDIDDEDGWHLLFLHGGGRQMSWHIAPRDVELFRHVERVDVADPRAQWDGHTTDEKYTHIADWTAETASARARPSTTTLTVTEAADIAEAVAVRLFRDSEVERGNGAYDVMTELRRIRDEGRK